MATRRNRTSACCRRFAGRESLTLGPTFEEAVRARRQELRNGQLLPYKSTGLLGRIAVDALVFEFMGLAMLALFVVVLAVPSRRPPARHISDT
jgi:hypothetical protein